MNLWYVIYLTKKKLLNLERNCFSTKIIFSIMIERYLRTVHTIKDKKNYLTRLLLISLFFLKYHIAIISTSRIFFILNYLFKYVSLVLPVLAPVGYETVPFRACGMKMNQEWVKSFSGYYWTVRTSYQKFTRAINLRRYGTNTLFFIWFLIRYSTVPYHKRNKRTLIKIFKWWYGISGYFTGLRTYFLG